MNKPFTNCILGVNVAITNMEDITNLITDHIDELKGQFICLSNVHTTIMAYDDEAYRKIQNAAFLALPDGSPLSFVQRFRGYKDASQVAGPDLMPSLWQATEGTEISHYFYGSSEETIAALRKRLETDYPNLKIAGMESPPYRPLTPEEDEEAIKKSATTLKAFVDSAKGPAPSFVPPGEGSGKSGKNEDAGYKKMLADMKGEE